MSERVYLFLDEHVSDCQIASANNGAVSMTDIKIKDLGNSSDIVVFVPATEVSCHYTPMNAAKPNELKQIAPYAIEDELAEPVENLHFALGPRTSDGHITIFAVSHEKMKAWTTWLRDNNISSAKLVVDASVIHQNGVMLDCGSRILAKLDERPLAIDSDLPNDAVRALASRAKSDLYVFGKELAERLSVKAADDRDFPPLAVLTQWAEQDKILIDLKQNQYADRKSMNFSLGTLKTPAILASVAAILFIGVTVGENKALNLLTQSLNRQAQASFAQSHPGQSMPADLSGLQSGRDVSLSSRSIDFLNGASALYANIPPEAGVSIRSLRYSKKDGKLTAGLTYPDYGADTDLKRKLEALGLRVTLGDARQQDGRVFSDIVVEATP